MACYRYNVKQVTLQHLLCKQTFVHVSISQYYGIAPAVPWALQKYNYKKYLWDWTYTRYHIGGTGVWERAGYLIHDIKW